MSDEPLSLHAIYNARHQEQKRLMAEYDAKVYYPSLKALREWCKANGGHRGGKYHDNGLGWSWLYCGRCGDRYDITGPDGQSSSDDEKGE